MPWRRGRGTQTSTRWLVTKQQNLRACLSRVVFTLSLCRCIRFWQSQVVPTLNISSTVGDKADSGCSAASSFCWSWVDLLPTAGCRALLSPRCWFMTTRAHKQHLSLISNTSSYLSDQWFSCILTQMCVSAVFLCVMLCQALSGGSEPQNAFFWLNFTEYWCMITWPWELQRVKMCFII